MTNIISTKNVYSAMIKNVFLPPTAESKILRHGFTRENINRVYELPFRIKNDIKISMFQYKIIPNILPTKVSLFRAKISDNDICPQCLTDRHSLDHMKNTALQLYLFGVYFKTRLVAQRKCHIIK